MLTPIVIFWNLTVIPNDSIANTYEELSEEFTTNSPDFSMILGRKEDNFIYGI